MQISPAHAQLQFSNSVDAPVNENATPCTNRLERDFVVPSNFTVGEAQIGVMMNHSYRGDLLMWLISPSGTQVQIFTGTGGTRNNFNVLMDDDFSPNVTSHNSNDTAGAGVTVPPYQRNFAPANALSAFDGENANGTWRLQICDRFNADSGTFRQADLFLTPAPASISSLKVSAIISDGISATNPKAIPGAIVRYCLLVSNAGPGLAEDVSSSDILPASLSYITGTMRSGSSCGGVGTVEDEDTVGADDSDNIAASVSGSTIEFSTADLAGGESIALSFDAIIQ